jgi:hypothetical protein
VDVILNQFKHDDNGFGQLLAEGQDAAGAVTAVYRHASCVANSATPTLMAC